MQKLTLAIAAAALAGLVSAPAAAEDLPSSKAAAAITNLVNLGVACSSAGPQDPGGLNSPPCPDASTDDTGFVPILRKQIKTANQKELALDLALQCGIVTDTTVKSKGGNTEGSNARGTIRVRIAVTDESSGVTRYAAPLGGLDAFGVADPINPDDTVPPEGIVYCDRFQQLEAKFAGLTCTANLTTGVVTCEDEEELRLLLRTLNASAFNFLAANLEPGVKTVTVEARAQAATAIIGTEMQSNAQAQAFAGAGSLFIEEIRMVKDDTGSNGL